MSRVPIRWRVVIAFAVAMSVVLTATGLLIYQRLGDDLSHALDQDLRLRAQDFSALVARPGRPIAAASGDRFVERGESFAQVLDAHGSVLDSSASLGGTPLVGGAAVAAAGPRARFVDRRRVPGLDEPARLLIVGLRRDGRPAALVVGATLENRNEALRSLRTELLIAGPLALLLATALGYPLAGAGLRAVEAMRRRAAAISAERPGERLPVPESGDELQRLGTTLNAMLERLEEALQRQRGFVAEAGHELRTPLALLRAELDYALHYAAGEEELRETVRAASEETDRLVQLAADLLLIAATDQGRLSLRIEHASARDVMASVCKRFAWRADADGRALELHAHDDLLIAVDRVRAEQALSNMVDNALRHGRGPVELHAMPAGDRVALHVRDRGPGFSPDVLSRAFERFSRGEESRSGPGTGLGLAIVQTIARAHGGEASACNRASGGADVQISFPAARRPGGPDTRTRPAALAGRGPQAA